MKTDKFQKVAELQCTEKMKSNVIKCYIEQIPLH